MIRLANLQFGYKSKQLLFNNLTLELEQGGIYGLFGINGAGKTTLIHLISGLLFPWSGSISVNGHIPSKRQVDMLSDMFVITEEFILPPISVKKYVDIHACFYKKFDYEMFHAIIKEFDIRINDKLHHLSFGQKKKCVIAFAIASRCNLLLMDEPTNGLDIPSKSQFRKMMASYIEEDRCVLISTHQVRDLSSIINHVIILNNQEIAFSQSTEKIINTLSFQILDEHEVSAVLYSEKFLTQVKAIMPNNGFDTEIDFELLFNAIIHDTEQICNPFKN